ncbi:hypothetical protein PV328_006978 [Microctonus aethiopoides]|uniref:Sodium-dependent nutrient amino acid transporter 1 n=1 Tax=Microctonus aethiopoides TaxID=144406 RepID=A0AA39FQ86_9HYME|nr:hypothetical protein PV328_006978 [Microctonus aethiopoides]
MKNSNCLQNVQSVLTTMEAPRNRTPEENTDELHSNRATWGNSIEFLMSTISFSVGLGNVWRFPHTAYENGGGAFVIAYVIVLFIVGKPLYYMESIIGQFTSRSCIKIWSVSPAFKGIGYGVTVSVFLVQSYYSGLTALILYYLVASFQSPLPWTICQDDWGEECFNGDSLKNSTVNENSIITKSSTELFFLKTVLNESGIQNGLGVPSWKLVLCLLANWITIFCVTFRGIESSGKASYFLALFPYTIMIGLFARAVTLDGAMNGIIYLFSPDWNKLVNPDIWYAAVTQSFFSLGVCAGGITMYSSYNKFDHNLTRDVMVVTFLDLCTSLLAGATIFGVLGNLAYELGRDDFKSIVRSGTGLAFISYPEALAKFSVVPSMFAVLFFLMLFVLSLGTSVALCSIITSVIKDQFHSILQWKIMLGISIAGFAVGISYCTPGGQYMVNLIDYFAGTFIIIFLASFEIIAIAWVYGIDNFLDDMEFMTGKRPSNFWRLCWGLFTPITLLTILIYFLCTLTPLKYNNENYPMPAYAVGWTILAMGIAPFVVIFIITIMKNRRKSMDNIFNPADEWGPANAKNREEWKVFKELRLQQRLSSMGKNKMSRLYASLSGKF